MYCKLLDSRNHIFSLERNTIFIISSFYICKCICNSKINNHGISTGFSHFLRDRHMCSDSCLMHIFQAEVDQGNPDFFVSSPILEASVLFVVYLVPHFLHCCVFFLVILLFKMYPKHSTEVLSSILTFKKAMIYLMKKIQVLGGLHLGISYSIVDCEFNVNKLMIYSN